MVLRGVSITKLTVQIIALAYTSIVTLSTSRVQPRIVFDLATSLVGKVFLLVLAFCVSHYDIFTALCIISLLIIINVDAHNAIRNVDPKTSQEYNEQQEVYDENEGLLL